MSDPTHPEDAADDYGCEHCRNDGALIDGGCPRCDAEYPEMPQCETCRLLFSDDELDGNGNCGTCAELAEEDQ